MASTKRNKRTTKLTTHDVMPEDTSSQKERSLYADFQIWTDKKRPSWHPVKKMRYVFFRMISGVTVSDALKEIRWNPSEFWHFIDLKRESDPFVREYVRAKKLQGRALADDVIAIAEGRDAVTRRSMAKTKKLITKALARAGKQKNPIAAKAVIEGLLAQMSANDSGIIARNKVQIESKKWLAKAVNPNEFSEKSMVAMSGATPDGEGGSQVGGPLLIRFVAPDGSIVDPFSKIPADTQAEAET